MDESSLNLLLALFAGLLCLASVGLLVGVFVVYARRGKEEAAPRAPQRAAPPPRVPAPRPQTPVSAQPTAPPPVRQPPASVAAMPVVSASAPAPVFADEGEDELPTVVVATPVRPPAQPAAPAAPAKPSRRDVGATIIAFDDDDGDDE